MHGGIQGYHLWSNPGCWDFLSNLGWKGVTNPSCWLESPYKLKTLYLAHFLMWLRNTTLILCFEITVQTASYQRSYIVIIWCYFINWTINKSNLRVETLSVAVRNRCIQTSKERTKSGITFSKVYYYSRLRLIELHQPRTFVSRLSGI